MDGDGGEEGVAAVGEVEVMVEEGTTLHVGKADFGVEVLLDWILEMCHHLPHRTVGLGEGEDVDVDVPEGVG